MNVLLIGGSSNFMNLLIKKFRKEGNRVFLLTGDKYRKSEYAKVFERYDFSYDSENLREIMESVRPDVTIFLGAFDTNFHWNDKGRETVRFTSNLINILVAYSEVKTGKFIYLSGADVFSGKFDEPIIEENRPKAIDENPRGSILCEAENICKNFKKSWDIDMTILRIDTLYGIPESLDDIANHPITDQILYAMKMGEIGIVPDNERSYIHEQDAVEFIFRCARKSAHNHLYYNLTSETGVTERQIAELIDSSMSTQNKVEEYGAEQEQKRILSAERFNREYGMKTMWTVEETIPKIVAYMNKHKAVFLEEGEYQLPWYQKLYQKWKWLLKALIPFVENLIVFIPFFMINNRVTDSQYFANLDPYLLYVLLFAIIYGQQQATFSALLAVVGYLFRQMYNRSGFEVLIDYNTYVWIAQLFILGLVVGYMRDQIRLIKNESEELEQHLSTQITSIREINGTNVRVKDVLEQEVIGQKDSIGKIYAITSKLDQYSPDEVLFYAAETLSELMESESVAVYNVVNGDFARLFSSTSEHARSLGNSIRYRELGGLYEELMERRVYINKTMDENLPHMANAIFENDEMQIILMVWDMNWSRMTLGQANFFAAVSYLIQNSVLRANRYLDALEERRYLEQTHLLGADAFSSLVRAYQNASDRGLAESILLRVQTVNGSWQENGTKIVGALRNTDYVGLMEDQKIYVLLPNSSEDNAQFVINRLKELGYASEIVKDGIL